MLVNVKSFIAVQGLAALYIGIFILLSVGYITSQYLIEKTIFEYLYPKAFSTVILLIPLLTSSFGCLIGFMSVFLC